MPVVNGVITAPFNTWTVAKTIGMSTGDIGTLVSKATDGTNAFDADGYIISGKKVYWNPFSNKSPGRWTDDGFIIFFKLWAMPWERVWGKGAYNLAEFEGYKHGTFYPEMYLQSSYNKTSNQTLVQFALNSIQFDFNTLTSPEYGGGLSKPIYLGVEVTAGVTKHVKVSTEPFTMASPSVADIIKVYGSHSFVTARALVRDSGGRDYFFDPSGDVLNNNCFNKTAQTVYPAQMIIGCFANYDWNGNFNGGVVTIQATQGGFNRDVRIVGYVVGYENGIASGRVGIMDGSFDITVPANSTQNFKKNFGGYVDWEGTPQSADLSIGIEINQINLTTDDYTLQGDHLMRPR